MRIRALVSVALAVALTTTCLAAPALAAAPATGDSPQLTVTGVVALVADGADGTTANIVAGNTVVAIQPDAVAGLAQGTTVEASLAIPAATLRELRVTSNVDLNSAVGEAVATAVDQPFAVTELAAVAPATAASTTAKQYVDVAVNVNSSGYADGYKQPTDTQIRTAIATSSAFWVKNTGGVFPGFTVRTITRYKSALTCDLADDFDWAAEGAMQVGHTLENGYLDSPIGSHLVVIGECRHDGKVAIGTVGDSLASGGFVVVEADMFEYSDANTYLDGTLSHEFGHNFGLQHANAQDTSACEVSAVPVYTDVAFCATEEYGDAWSVMGYSMPESYAPLLDIARRDQLGVADTSMLAEQGASDAQPYVLNSMGAASGLKGVKIHAASGDTYYVEYRDGTGEAGAYYLLKGTGCSSGWEPSPQCKFSPTISPRGPGVRVLMLAPDGSTRVEGVKTQAQAPAWVEDALDTGDWWRSESGDVDISITAAASGTASITVTTGPMAPVSVGAVTLSRTPVVGLPVTAVVGASVPASAALTYRWFRGGVQIAGATSATYTPVVGMAGSTLSVLVEARSATYAPSQRVSAQAEIIASVPTISGPVRANVTLTAVGATQVPPTASSTYQWIVNGADVPGATAPTFAVHLADIGATVAVRVAATWTDGTGSHASTLTSEPFGPVGLAENWVGSLPQISGSATVGGSLVATPGVTTPASLVDTFQWRRDGVAIPGAEGFTLDLTQADYGSHISVEVTHTATGFEPFPQVSSAVVVGGDLVGANLVPPSISGTGRVGDTLTAAPGTWAANFVPSYQWLRAGQAISGATASTYVPTALDLGTQIAVTVTGTHQALGAWPLTTDPVTIDRGVLTAPMPTISGIARVGNTVTAAPGTWTAGTTFTYRWYANGVAIVGATASTFVVPTAVAGKLLTVEVTGAKPAYSTTAVTSASQGVPIVGKVTVTGIAGVGHTLTAHHGTWTSGTTFTYQWYAGGVAIPGATKYTYKVTAGHVGKTMSVHVKGVKVGFTSAVAISASTAKVTR